MNDLIVKEEVLNTKLRHFEALINKVQTTTDGGIRVTLDFDSQSGSKLAAFLMEKHSKNDSLINLVFIDYSA